VGRGGRVLSHWKGTEDRENQKRRAGLAKRLWKSQYMMQRKPEKKDTLYGEVKEFIEVLNTVPTTRAHEMEEDKAVWIPERAGKS